MCIYKYILRGKKIIWFLQCRKCGQKHTVMFCDVEITPTDLQLSKVIQEIEVSLNQWIIGCGHVWTLGNILKSIFVYLFFFGIMVLNSLRSWILSSELERQFYTVPSYTSGCIFSSEMELMEQREKRFFFRCLWIFRNIFTIIFLTLHDNNRLVRAERGSWAQLCMVAVTSGSGQLLALFLAAQKQWGRHCTEPGESW